MEFPFFDIVQTFAQLAILTLLVQERMRRNMDEAFDDYSAPAPDAFDSPECGEPLAQELAADFATAVEFRKPRRKVRDVAQVLKNGAVHHCCEVDSPDYHEAFRTPGLTLRHADGSIVEGVQ